ncbi:MAG: ADP-ribose pyrophosphatase [Dethiosulfovibrio peptidovorans]|nr:MAG: ADP-ribose pyrophosphatase [Dethiosulfovibrio peptidovorans]
MDRQEKTISKNTVYRGRILNLRVDNVQFPDGRRTQREVVEHTPAVGIVAISDKCLFLVEQYRYAVQETLFEIPAGLIEPGETPEQTAHRELQEEIGYRAQRLEPLGRLYVSPGFTDEVVFLFLAEGLTPSKLPADDDESITVRRFPWSSVWEMIRDETIRDGKTVAILTRLALERKIPYH